MGWLLAVSVAVIAVLVASVFLQRRRIESLCRALDDAVGSDTIEVITIQIRNHGQVAAGRTAFARPLAVLTPGLLRGIVHRETVKMLRVELADNGVDADVRLRRLVRPPSRDADRSGSGVPDGEADAGADDAEL